jgi:myosin heavy subunit
MYKMFCAQLFEASYKFIQLLPATKGFGQVLSFYIPQACPWSIALVHTKVNGSVFFIIVLLLRCCVQVEGMVSKPSEDVQQVQKQVLELQQLKEKVEVLQQQQQQQSAPSPEPSQALQEVQKQVLELQQLKQKVEGLQQQPKPALSSELSAAMEQVNKQVLELQQLKQQVEGLQQQPKPALSSELSIAMEQVNKQVLELQQLKQQVEGLQQQPKPALSSELSTATEQVNKQVLELQQLKQKVEKVQQQLQQKHQQQPTQGAEPSEVLQKVQRQVLELQHQQQQQRQHLSDGRPPAAAVAGALPDSEPQLAQRVKAAEGTVAKLRGLVENKTTDGMVPRGEMMRALEAVTSSVLGRLKKVACHDVVCVHAAVGVAHMDSKAQEISLFVCFPVVEM